MVDRIEREIEEILAKLEDQPPVGGGPQPERTPVSIASARKKKQSKPRPNGSSLLNRIDPPLLMFAGAGTMILGLVAASFAGALIWLSFAGVVLFLGAFLLSFRRRSTSGPARPGGSGGPAQGKFWRDRYIDYKPPSDDPVSKIKRRFRR